MPDDSPAWAVHFPAFRTVFCHFLFGQPDHADSFHFAESLFLPALPPALMPDSRPPLHGDEHGRAVIQGFLHSHVQQLYIPAEFRIGLPVRKHGIVVPGPYNMGVGRCDFFPAL